MHVAATSEACYTHMHERHGGIFDEDMDAAEARREVRAQAQPGPAAFVDIPAEYILEDAQARALAAARLHNGAAYRFGEKRQLIVWEVLASANFRRADAILDPVRRADDAIQRAREIRGK